MDSYLIANYNGTMYMVIDLASSTEITDTTMGLGVELVKSSHQILENEMKSILRKIIK